MPILIAIAALVAIFVLVLVVRALRFTPRPQPEPEEEDAPINEARAVENLAAMIRCRTVSHNDHSQDDAAEFEKFRALLDERFARVSAVCEKISFGRTGVMYRLPGHSAESPSVLMAHYDVVPAEADKWTHPPFAAVLDSGALWGRGTLDTKGTLNAILEAAETLIERGFKPKNDIYFAFSGDEEVSGPSAPEAVKWFKARGITPGLVLDEGGAVVSNVFPGVKDRCALIGTGEKGIMNVQLDCRSAGGHASSPPPHTPVGVLAEAVCKIERRPFPLVIPRPTAEMFDTLGRRSSFAYRLIFANLWCFRPVLSIIGKSSGGELNALMRTTCAFTKMEGSEAWNVIPPSASVGANLRLISETPAEAVDRMKKVVKNDDITFTIVTGVEPTRHSPTNTPAYAAVSRAILATWPGSIVSPYLMMAASDSRHYAREFENVYRFSAMELSKEERATIHGHDERVPVETIVKAAQFYVRLMRRL